MIALAGAVRPASAAPSVRASDGQTFELAWDAPAGCPDVGSVRQDVDRVVGDTGDVHRKLRVQGEVRSDAAGGWTATVTLVTETGRSVRTLTAPTCRAVARAAAVVIAFAMTAEDFDVSPSNGDEPRTADIPTIEHPRATQVGEPKPLPSESEKARARPSSAGPTIGVLTRVDIGTLPKVGFGPGVLIGWYARPIFLEASFGWLLGQDSDVVAPPPQSATVSRATFAAFYARTAVCPAEPGLSIARRQLRVFGCTGFGILQTRANGHPIDMPVGERGSSTLSGETIEGWSGSVFAGPRLRFSDGWFALSASLDVAVPFRPQEFVLKGRSGGGASVFRTAPVLIGMTVTAELSFFP